MMPKNLFLNPIMDEKSLEEIYNVGDYPPLDYTYDNYDGDEMKTIDFNETTWSSTETVNEEDLTSPVLQWNNTLDTTGLEQNDTFDTSTIPTFDNATGTSLSGFSEEVNATSLSTVDSNKPTAYDEVTEIAIHDTTDASTTSEDSITASSTSERTVSSTTENDTFGEHSIITTLETSTESPMITTISTEETTDKMSTVDSSSTSVNEGVIPLAAEDYVVQCFEQVCTTTTQDTSMN